MSMPMSTPMSTPISSSEPAVVLKDLRVAFGKVQVVDGVDLTVERGQAMALIGESGSGKSVTLRAILRLFPEGRSRIEGRILAADRDVQALTKRQLADFRGGDVSMIFQEPLLAFDPVYTVGRQITEAILRHETISKDEARKRALALFERVRIPSPERRLDNYPHEMSGGMRQRAMIALALACRPQVLLADEPTRRWTPRCRSRCCCSCASSSATSACRSSSSPTISARPWRSPTGLP